jgi:DNA polymerase-3 subunit delta
MIVSFSGDPFLARRAARRALSARGLAAAEIQEIAEDLTPETFATLAGQAGLFGRVGFLLDFDAAFKGKSGVKPRNDTIKVLATVPEETVVAVIDLTATASRQKTYQKLGEHVDVPTPRFNALTHWIRQELDAQGVTFNRDVPQTLADLFAEDLPAIASEVNKLALLDEKLSSDRVQQIVNRPAARNAFDLIDAITAADKPKALAICHSLQAQGEAPARVLGALTWQYNLVAHCVALRESRAQVSEGQVVQTLKVKPFVAKKALGIAKVFDEKALRQVLGVLLAADVAVKSGGDPTWALESAALQLAALR